MMTPLFSKSQLQKPGSFKLIPMMKPFVSNHPLFHPDRSLRALLERLCPSLLPYLSGRSLKYLRSGFAVYSFQPDEQTYIDVKEALPRIFHDIADRNLMMAEHSTKIVLPAKYCEEREVHLLIHNPSARHDLQISVDDLFYDWDQSRWQGPSYQDYEGGVLRLVSPTELTMAAALKLCAMTSMLDFTPDDETLTRIREAKPDETLHRSFLRTQLQKIVTGARPSQGFITLERAGLLDAFLPELAASRGLTQNRFHRYDIFHHCIYSCDSVERNDLHLRLAGLLHDIGKVPTRRQTSSGEPTFHSHEVVGAKITGNILHRFGFNKELIQRVKFLVRNHMFHYTAEWTDRTVRRFLARVSLEELTDLIDLRMADRQGSGKGGMLPPQIRKLLHHVEKIRSEEAELKIRDLQVKGEDFMALGIPPGPLYGDILKELLEKVKKGELENTKEALLPAMTEAISRATKSSTG
ncbi:HD domain-containing protein [Leptonema illini]|uniref:Metal-dependent phosphohydrolase HD sub domain-containing protein n=1 Tax=Leptonema illini DSM 21528 TaxID=929563 RepID=H2CD19_9LEPT|nr:HD domain-containing protein [Leptonema illini]EHQ07495.1 metal-dependent phosphohydrolase HD sub domain-containing protein [Leptonema illini DSM 21528]